MSSSSSPDPHKRLPVRPSAEHLRKQAKRRAKADAIPLTSAQHALAQEYGYGNWAALMSHVGQGLNSGESREAALHRAVVNRRIDQVKRLLTEGSVDVHHRADHGVTALHLAARHGPAGMVKLLLDAGARQWLEDDAGKTPIDYAREIQSTPDSDAIVALLTQVHFGDDAFAAAVAALDAGDVERLRQLLRDHPHLTVARAVGGDAIMRGYFSRPTLLHFVAANPTRNDMQHMPPRILESTAAILDAGADPNALTEHGGSSTTVAMVASSAPAHTDQMVEPMLELLVRRGADPTSGLDAAMLHRLVDTVRLLLKLGAKHTPVSAAGLDDAAALRRLIDDGLSHDQLVRAGWSAAMNGRTNAIDMLLDAGLDPNVILPRPYDPTMMHEAALNGYTEVCERLLAHGADPMIRDTQYHATPAGWAEYAGHRELAGYLHEAESKSKTSKP